MLLKGLAALGAAVLLFCAVIGASECVTRWQLSLGVRPLMPTVIIEE
jgi:hypothetical protein